MEKETLMLFNSVKKLLTKEGYWCVTVADSGSLNGACLYIDLTEPKTYKSLISNLNKSYHETQGHCYDPDYVEEATENDYVNAEAKGYRTSEAS